MADPIKTLPRHFEIWKHYKGGLYLILDVLNTLNGGTEKFPITVAYMNLATMERFCRKLEIFMEKFTYQGSTHMEGVLGELALDASRRIVAVGPNDLLGGSAQYQAHVQVEVERAVRCALTSLRVAL